MAPGFLSKFQKQPARDRSFSFSRSPSPGDNHSAHQPSISSTSLAKQPTSTKNSSKNPSRAHTPDPSDNLSVHTNHSTNPSVTIGVVPPSPTAHSDVSFPRDASPDDPPPPAKESLQDRRNERKPALSFSFARPSKQAEPIADPLITPTPGKGGNGQSELASSPALARVITPSSSTGNLRQFVQQAEAHSPEKMLFGDNSSGSVQRQASERSNGSQGTPAPIPIAHGKAATSPTSVSSYDTITPTTSYSGGDDSILSGMSPISESPTNVRTFSASPPQSPGFDPISRTQTHQTINASLLSPGSKDSDSVSIISSNGGDKKKSKWRRPSASKKPTGLASAIAASGLAMANPAMTAPQLAQASQVQLPVSTSPPKQNGAQRKHSRHIASASAASVGSTSLEAPRRSRARTGSISNRSDNSEAMYDSGLEGISSDEDDSGSEDELDLREDIPVTGFAVASNKRNADFHELFSNIPEGDYLIEDYGCALQREILIQGRIYISENHICFHANIFGWITDLSIPIYEIIALEKKMTAFVIPNAIQITTRQAKYSFASFLSRDTTYDVIYNIWRLARPDDNLSPGGSMRGSLDNVRSGMDQVRENGSMEGVNGGGAPVGGVAVAGARAAKPSLLKNKVTQCACGKRGEHYSETALETIVPGTPDKIYNLMFASGFIKDFMKGDQKLLEIQISDWAPISVDSKLLTRNMSYIKPLYASLGPKQTKCEIKDETVFCDFEDYVVTVTTTRTPDVPSGGVFSVKTRTCIMWASAASTKVIVTTQVEWTGRSFIKGIIEKSAVDGQKVYHADLDRGMRSYIQQHQSEFVPEGIEAIAVAPIEAKTAAGAPTTANLADNMLDDKTREKQRNQRGLQWAYDTFEGAYNVAKQSTSGALELISDAWDQSTSTTILIFLIVILVISNVWTLTMVGRREDLGRRKEMRKTQEKEKWVEGIVTALWEELAAGKPGSLLPPSTSPVSGNWQEEVAKINQTLDAVEDRIRLIRDTLNALD